MSFSFTSSNSKTFTSTHAKQIAAKVATDLRRILRLYGSPSELRIEQFETEVVELLKAGYLKKVTYGFQRNGNWIEPTLIYNADELSGSEVDDDPGKVRPNADISGASFYSYLIYSSKWDNLSSDDRKTFESELPFQRSGAESPGIDGYTVSDKRYSSGGKALDRSSVKSY